MDSDPILGSFYFGASFSKILFEVSLGVISFNYMGHAALKTERTVPKFGAVTVAPRRKQGHAFFINHAQDLEEVALPPLPQNCHTLGTAILWGPPCSYICFQEAHVKGLGSSV